MIIIIEAGMNGTLTETAIKAIEGADKLFIQSGLHPCADQFSAFPHGDMDDLYEGAEDFDALQTAIAARLQQHQDCVYCTWGACDLLLERLSTMKVPYQLLPGIPLGKSAYPEAVLAQLTYATSLPKHPDIHRDLIIQEVDSRIAAGEIKLLLTEYYPDEHPINIALSRDGKSFEIKQIKLYELDRQRHFNATTCILVPALQPKDMERYGFDELMDLLAYLRSPQGCPWDRVQTIGTLRECMVEEAYEAADAAACNDMDALCEELGDVLMQVGMNALIAEEHGAFTIRDVMTELAKKLIFRHPHVFLHTDAQTPQDALRAWDESN